MIQLHFDVNQLNIGKSTGGLHLFAWNYINYANMEGFSHICVKTAVVYGVILDCSIIVRSTRIQLVLDNVETGRNKRDGTRRENSS